MRALKIGCVKNSKLAPGSDGLQIATSNCSSAHRALLASATPCRECAGASAGAVAAPVNAGTAEAEGADRPPTRRATHSRRGSRRDGDRDRYVTGHFLDAFDREALRANRISAGRGISCARSAVPALDARIRASIRGRSSGVSVPSKSTSTKPALDQAQFAIVPPETGP